MSADPQSILLTTLWQRRSPSGSEYLNGYLGKARLVGIKRKPQRDGNDAWTIYVMAGEEQEKRKTQPPGEPRTHVTQTRCGVQRWAAKATKSPAGFE